MTKNRNFGFSQSELLTKAKQTGLSLTRDLESLKNDGIEQKHIDKLFMLIAQAENTGTAKEFAPGKLYATGTIDEVRLEILHTIKQLEGWMNLNSEQSVAAKRMVYIREVQKAKIGTFSQKLLELQEQLRNLQTTVKEMEGLDTWINRIDELNARFHAACDLRTENKQECAQFTMQRGEALNNMYVYLSMLSGMAKRHWQYRNNPYYKDYVLNPRRKAQPAPQQQ